MKLTICLIKSSGHSKGSLNMLFEEDRILFTADSVPLKNNIPNHDNFSELMDSLEVIKNNSRFDMLLTSWTPPMSDKEEIMNLIREGKEYMKHIDTIVRDCYEDKNTKMLDHCRIAVNKLGLPPFLLPPIVDKAFKSHLK